MDDLGTYVTDDDLAADPLKTLGWDVDTVSWKAKRDWSEFEAVIIRSPWDYHKSPDLFLETLIQIESQTLLLNPSKIVEWNLDKSYLRDLENRGVKIVPTLFENDSFDQKLFENWLSEFMVREIIIKPTVSATAKDTFRLGSFSSDVSGVFRHRKYMIQPFMKNIAREGEYSLFYFNGDFSHAILKTPKQNDFRVQEDFGGVNRSITPGGQLLRAGEKALKQIGQKLLYARVDFVRDDEDEFALMELELIEPALYFRMDKESPKRFAEAFDKWMEQ